MHVYPFNHWNEKGVGVLCIFMCVVYFVERRRGVLEGGGGGVTPIKLEPVEVLISPHDISLSIWVLSRVFVLQVKQPLPDHAYRMSLYRIGLVDSKVQTFCPADSLGGEVELLLTRDTFFVDTVAVR